MRRAVARATATAVVLAASSLTTVRAASLEFCDRAKPVSAAQQDLLFRFADLIKADLEASGQRLALVARSGTDLHRLGLRYSHAGVSLRAGATAPWAVRQLYYACDEQRPRLFDQGLSGFLFGADSPDSGYLSIVFLPAGPAAALEHVSADNARALALLNARYSANAYAFSTRYQNCNQWLAELLATAWNPAAGGSDPRAQAQQWLQDQGYAPSIVHVGIYRGLAAFIPWVHGDDHPPEDLAQEIYRVSMPDAIEQFVHVTVPGATRVEYCRQGRRVVKRRGWTALAEGCQPGEDDEITVLD